MSKSIKERMCSYCNLPLKGPKRFQFEHFSCRGLKKIHKEFEIKLDEDIITKKKK